MIDREIIKALEPYKSSRIIRKADMSWSITIGDFLDLIKRYEAEIEKYQKLDELAEKTIDIQTLVIKELRSEVATLKGPNINLQNLYQNQKEKMGGDIDG